MSNNETLQARRTHSFCMVIVWTACFSGLCTLAITPLISIQCLQYGVAAWTMHMLQCGWGSEEGDCQPSFEGSCADPRQPWHGYPLPAPPFSLLGGGCVQENLQTVMSLVHADAHGHVDPLNRTQAQGANVLLGHLGCSQW